MEGCGMLLFLIILLFLNTGLTRSYYQLEQQERDRREEEVALADAVKRKAALTA